VDKENMVHIHNGILFALKKEEKGNPVTCDNMDGTGGHSARSNNPGTERQVLCVLTPMWHPKQLNS
jgi:hypothetical protein